MSLITLVDTPIYHKCDVKNAVHFKNTGLHGPVMSKKIDFVFAQASLKQCCFRCSDWMSVLGLPGNFFFFF